MDGGPEGEVGIFVQGIQDFWLDLTNCITVQYFTLNFLIQFILNNMQCLKIQYNFSTYNLTTTKCLLTGSNIDNFFNYYNYYKFLECKKNKNVYICMLEVKK